MVSAVAMDDIELARDVEALRLLPPQPESTAAAPHIKHDATGNLRLTGSLTLPRVSADLNVTTHRARFGDPEPRPPGQTYGLVESVPGPTALSELWVQMRAWTGQAEPCDRLTWRDCSPMPAVALSPPKLRCEMSP